jgi:hypothetical protein
MSAPTENPAQRGNAAAGSVKRPGKRLSSTSPERGPPVKAMLVFRVPGGGAITVSDHTRLADVALRLLQAEARGVSAADFEPGVRLGGIVFQLRRLGFPVDTTRQRVPGDAFGAVRAIYRTPLRVFGREAP